MLRRKESYTVTTPIPPNVPPTLALSILHSHSEIITLNPLVLTHTPIKAPRDAPADEYYSTWYEITERVQYIPGVGKIGSGKISFKACFHDETWGIRAHTYAPMSIDLRAVYRLVEPVGLDSHIQGQGQGQGLLLEQEVTIECNRTLISFVKGQMKASTKVLVDRFIKKAELLDAGVLQGTVEEDGKLRTYNPADRTSTFDMVGPGPASPASPVPRRMSYQIPRSPSQMSRSESVSSQPQTPHQQQQFPRHDSSGGRTFAAELPADTYHPYRSPRLDKGGDGGFPASPRRFPAELPAMQEGVEERSEPRKYTYQNYDKY
ncbi:hypothetical protein BJX99DRAFT_86562 [Aspergillus californicus]